MAEERKQTKNPSKPRHGKSVGKCIKCGAEFKLKRNTKHNKTKLIQGICSQCSFKK